MGMRDPEIVPTPLSAASRWLRRQRDRRRIPRREVASHVLDEVLAQAAAEGVSKRILVVVAHPDDEAIGAGALLRGIPDVTVAHLTDGAPADDEYARCKGYDSREAYAAARRKEVVAALEVIGIPAERIRQLGFIDGELAWHLVELSHAVMQLIDELKPDVIVTHPYEGGHSDHDSAAFAVHLACGTLKCEGAAAPLILELTSYHNYNGRRRTFSFLPFGNLAMRTLRLSAESRWIKRKMFEQFESQRALLETFPIEVERFRQAPRYLFTVPPHDGQLDYERRCKKVSGAEWRAQAERALEALRTRRQFRSGAA